MKKKRSYLRSDQIFLILIKGRGIEHLIILLLLLFTGANVHAQSLADRENNVIILVVKNGATMYGSVEDFNHQNLDTKKSANGDIVWYRPAKNYGDSLIANSAPKTSHHIDFSKEAKLLRKEKEKKHRQIVKHYDNLSQRKFPSDCFINLPVSEQFFVSKKSISGSSILPSNHFTQISDGLPVAVKSLHKYLDFLATTAIEGDQTQFFSHAYFSFYPVRPPPSHG